jgi:hypothetical protein
MTRIMLKLKEEEVLARVVVSQVKRLVAAQIHESYVIEGG